MPAPMINATDGMAMPIPTLAPVDSELLLAGEGDGVEVPVGATLELALPSSLEVGRVVSIIEFALVLEARGDSDDGVWLAVVPTAVAAVSPR